MFTLRIILVTIGIVLSCISIGLAIWSMVLNRQSRKLWQKYNQINTDLVKLNRRNNDCDNCNDGRDNRND